MSFIILIIISFIAYRIVRMLCITADYACIVRLSSAEFARICDNLSEFGETMWITCTMDGIFLSTSCGVSAANFKFVSTVSISEEEDAVCMEMREPITMKFDCRLLTASTKAIPLAAQVQLSLAANVPLVVEYEVKNFGHIRYYLTPESSE